MRTGSASIVVNAPVDVVFDLIHDYERRLEWDPFLREARLLAGAQLAGLGISSRCIARWMAGGAAMDTRYVTFNRPKVAAVKMTNGPFFLESFAATIRHDVLSGQSGRVTYKYHFSCAPRIAPHLLEPLVHWVFHGETVRRLAALRRYLEGKGPGRDEKDAST